MSRKLGQIKKFHNPKLSILEAATLATIGFHPLSFQNTFVVNYKQNEGAGD